MYRRLASMSKHTHTLYRALAFCIPTAAVLQVYRWFVSPVV